MKTLKNKRRNYGCSQCWINIVSGGVFFFTLAIYSLYHFPRGHFGLRLETRNEQRDAIYFASGVTILGCMFVMGIQLFLLPVGMDCGVGVCGSLAGQRRRSFGRLDKRRYRISLALFQG